MSGYVMCFNFHINYRQITVLVQLFIEPIGTCCLLHSQQKCEYVFYRGSSAVFECIFNGIYPIYIDNNDGINVDPLFFVKKNSKLYSNNGSINLDSFLKNEKKKFYKVRNYVDKFYSKSNFDNFYYKVLKKNI